MYLERENNYWSCWFYKGVVCPPYMVHLDLVGLWVVLLWPPLLTHGPLSYLVLAFLLCVYLCYDDFYLMSLWYTNLISFYLLVGPFTLL